MPHPPSCRPRCDRGWTRAASLTSRPVSSRGSCRSAEALPQSAEPLLGGTQLSGHAGRRRQPQGRLADARRGMDQPGRAVRGRRRLGDPSDGDPGRGGQAPQQARKNSSSTRSSSSPAPMRSPASGSELIEIGETLAAYHASLNGLHSRRVSPDTVIFAVGGRPPTSPRRGHAMWRRTTRPATLLKGATRREQEELWWAMRPGTPTSRIDPGSRADHDRQGVRLWSPDRQLLPR